MMHWIDVQDKIFHRKINHPYMVYGHQLASHWPGKAIAAWDGKVWYAFDDEDYVYREEEIDCYMDVLNMPDPTKYG